MKKALSSLIILSALVANTAFAQVTQTQPTPVDQSNGCSSITLTSSAQYTQTAGWANVSPISSTTNPLDPTKYSAGAFVPAVVTNPVIPPWVDPATDGHFAGSGALWVSDTTGWPGDTANGGEGLGQENQWRLFRQDFTLPAGAVGSISSLSYTADNAASAYLIDGSSTMHFVGATPLSTYAPTPASIPLIFSSVYTGTFMPKAGTNSLYFVVRNSSFDGSVNPTGLLYKAVVHYCIPPATVKVTIDKFLDGVQATADNANSTNFPMVATWNTTNFAPGTGNYALGPVGFNSPNPYFAVTSDMNYGAGYTTSEVTDGDSVVVPYNRAHECPVGKYMLVGYSSGNSLDEAIKAPKSPTAPNFTHLGYDKYIIVWNRTCAGQSLTNGQ